MWQIPIIIKDCNGNDLELGIIMNIVVDGYNICYKTTGTGDKTVVILQGWGTDLGVYDSVAGVIDGSRYRVIQFDFPGFGGSDEPKEPWDVDGFADFFCRFMEVMQVKQATLIGHSYGGRVIIKLAARESIPFEITNIILIDTCAVDQDNVCDLKHYPDRQRRCPAGAHYCTEMEDPQVQDPEEIPEHEADLCYVPGGDR